MIKYELTNSNKLNKSLDDLDKKTGLDNSFDRRNFEKNLMDDLRKKLLNQDLSFKEWDNLYHGIFVNA